MRVEDFQDRTRSLDFAPGMTRRDQTSVERISSGLIKVLYPDGRLSDEERTEVAELACELRQRVHNQLAEIAPGEFKARHIGLAGREHEPRDLRIAREVLPHDDRLNRDAVVGAVTGLGVEIRDGVPVAGSTILIQASAYSAGAGLDVTGCHGSVLKDSVKTAYNVVRLRFRELGIPERRLQDQRVVIHLVRIAEPRDGPSAGIVFVTGIVSALTGKPVRPACALTGEVTLLGEVIGVGGIPLKIRAAAKAGRKLVLIPAENGKEVAQVPNDVLAKVEVVPIRTIQEALERVLQDVPQGQEMAQS
jgi:ATP-dependent Lon protease